MTKITKVEVLFYGGIVMVAAAIIAVLIFALIYVLKKVKLDRKLMDEYGEPEKYNIHATEIYG